MIRKSSLVAGMKYKIVADSSADVLSLTQVAFSNVPLHIVVGEQEFVDDENVDLKKMQEALTKHKGKTSTACPGPEDWITSFGGAENVFCVTITSGLSGSHASAQVAKQMYEETNPGKCVYIIDSLSAGPEITLIVEKLQEMILAEEEPQEIYRKIIEYKKRTHLYFSLASLDNLAKNGRVSPILAKGVGLLNIRIVGKASDVGQLQSLDKCRGQKKGFQSIIKHMKEHEYADGKIIISHNNNTSGAEELKQMIVEEFGKFRGYIHETRALCSYYAEPGSLLIGFEANLK